MTNRSEKKDYPGMIKNEVLKMDLEKGEKVSVRL